MKIFNLISMGIHSRRYQAVVQHRADGDDDNNDDDNKPSESEAKLIKEVMAKKDKITTLSGQLESQATQMSEQATALADVQNQLKVFANIDPEKYQEMLNAAKANEDKELMDKGEWETLKGNLETSHESEKAQMADAHATALKTAETTAQEKIKELTDKLSSTNGLVEDLTVGTSFSSSKFVNDSLVPAAVQVRALYGSHFDVESGKVVAYDKPRGNAERAKLVDGNGQTLNFDSALEKIVGSDSNGESILRSQRKPGSNGDSENVDGKDKGDPNDRSKMGVNRITAALNKQSK